MTLSFDYARLKLATTLTEAVTCTATHTENTPTGGYTIDYVATVNGVSTIFAKVVIEKRFEGSNLFFKHTLYRFSGTAATSTYVSASNPPVSNAVASQVHEFNAIDLDAIWTTGLDLRVNS